MGVYVIFVCLRGFYGFTFYGGLRITGFFGVYEVLQGYRGSSRLWGSSVLRDFLGF
ncbi:hypothetical protein AXF42_Ash017682 [Apostasia shenzhenica]|uniref:Uncharacterized protein n=1 Tax=Apostasia shenzhenica TaxID=1088818 RepID=A0A2I0A5I9_9ASPA|nr:hypothetical protein AXF42_Ash017682 [Apostasia shenzhenica]